MVGMFVCLCLASKKPSAREFFVPAGTDLTAKLLSDILMRESKNASSRRKPHKIAASKL